MKQASLIKTGGPDSFKIQSIETPPVGKNQILVKVDHAGVAFADVMMRHGKYPRMPKLPFTPGYDICGTVQAIGKSVTDINIGDKVIALTQFGGYSQFSIVHYKRAIKVPNDIDSSEAVALVLNYISAYQMLSKHTHQNSNKKILIHSAAGGVGTAATQIALLLGYKVYGTCSTTKVKIVEKCGGIPIDYTKNDFVKTLKELEPEGFDLILDPIGGDHWLKSIEVLKRKGLLIGYGFFSMFQKDKIIGSVMDSGKLILSLSVKSLWPWAKKFKLYSIRPDHYKEIQSSLKEVLNMYIDGKIKPVIYRIYPLDEVSKAHYDLVNSLSYGKIVLDCRE